MTIFLSLIRLAGPIILGQLCFMAMDITDAIMAGYLGEMSLAAVATAGSYFIPVLLVIFGINMVLSPVVSRYVGENGIAEIGPATQRMMVIGLIFSVPFMAICFFAYPLLLTIGVADSLAALSSDYLFWRMWGLIGVVLFMAMRFFYEGIGVTWPFVSALLAGAVLNVVLNIVFMYGAFGFSGLGVGGIGLATSVVDYVLLVVMMGISFFGRFRVYEVCSRVHRLDWGRVWRLFKLGVPSGLMFGAEVSLFAVMGLILATVSADQVAVHQVALNVSALCFMVPFGFSTALSSRVGYLIGSKVSRSQIMRTVKIGGMMSVGASFFLGLMVLIFRPMIAQLYHLDATNVALATLVLAVVGVFQVADGFQVTLNGALKGFQDTFVPMWCSIVGHWVFGFIPGMVLGLFFGLGVLGFWMGIGFSLLMTGVFLAIRFWVVAKRVT